MAPVGFGAGSGAPIPAPPPLPCTATRLHTRMSGPFPHQTRDPPGLLDPMGTRGRLTFGDGSAGCGGAALESAGDAAA
jgi:hypothetical protein